MTEHIQPPQAFPAIYAAMAACMTDVDAIAKGKKTSEGAAQFKYRGIDDVYNMIHPVLSLHKVFMTSEIIEKTRQERTNQRGTVLAFTTLRMRFTFWTVDGSSVSTVVEGEGMDSGDKSSNKAMSIAHKYALLQAFCIPTEDAPDPDAEVHTVAPVTNWKVWGADLAARLKAAKTHAELVAINDETADKFRACEAESPKIADRIAQIYQEMAGKITEMEAA